MPSVIRIQSATGTGNPNATATFTSTPSPGNLLIAITGQRVGADSGLVANIDGVGWTRQINNYFKTVASTADRRGLGVFYKIAGINEPTAITTNWVGTSPGVNNLIIQEFAIVGGGEFIFDTSTSNNSGSTTVTSLSTGTTATSKQADSFMVTGYMNRDGTQVVSWTNGFGDNTRYVTGGIDVQTAFKVDTVQSTKETTASWGTARRATAGILVFSINSLPKTPLQNSQQYISATGQTTYSPTHNLLTGLDGGRLVVVTVSYEHNGLTDVSSVTFDGESPNGSLNVVAGTNPSARQWLGWWFNANLPSTTGNKTVAVTCAGAITQEIYVTVTEFLGIAQTTPNTNTATITSAGNISTSVTVSEYASIAVGAFTCGETGFGAPFNLIELQSSALTSSAAGVGYNPNANPSSTTIGWHGMTVMAAFAGAVFAPLRPSVSDFEYCKRLIIPKEKIEEGESSTSILLDAATSGGHSSGASSRTLSHTIGSQSNRLLVVHLGLIGNPSGGVVDVTGVTYNGVAMTLAANIGGNYNGWGTRSVIYYMLEANLPAAGAYNIVASFNKSASESFIGAVSYYNVKQQAPTNTATNADGDTSNPSTSITTTEDNSLIVESLNHHATGVNLSAANSQTERWDTAGSYQRQVGSDVIRTTAGTASVGWTGGPLVRWTHAVAAFAPIVGAANHLDFPVLIKIENDDDLKSVDNGGFVVNNDGTDLVFSTQSQSPSLLGEPMDFELVNYTPTNGSVTAWVKVPVLYPDQDNIIEMHFGQTSVLTYNTARSAAVWESNYVGVYHFEETGAGASEEYKDHTSFYNHGQGGAGQAAQLPSRVTGKVLYGQDFESTESDYIRIPYDGSSLNITNALCIEAWINMESLPTAGNYMSVVGKQYGTGTADSFQLAVSNTGAIYLFYNGGSINSGSNVVTTGNWFHIAAMLGTGGTRIYINGDSVGSGAVTSTLDDVNDVFIGAMENDASILSLAPTQFFDGVIDEVRISKSTRSAGWIKTVFTNENDPVNFIQIVDYCSNLINTRPFLRLEWINRVNIEFISEINEVSQ